MNPLENESVVGAVLQKYAGHVELDPQCNKVPAGPKHNPGLTTWRVPDPRLSPNEAAMKGAGTRGTVCGATTEAASATTEAASAAADNKRGAGVAATTAIPPDAEKNVTVTWIDSKDAIPSELQPQNAKVAVRQTMFPPEHAIAAQLTNCIRLLPHHNDAGGFFCAVLRKTSPLSDPDEIRAQMEAQAAAAAATTAAAAAPAAQDQEPPPTQGTPVDPAAMQVSAADPPTSQSAAPPPKRKQTKKGKGTKQIGGDLFYNKQQYHELAPGSDEHASLERFYGIFGSLCFFSFTDKGGDDRKIAVVSKGVRDWLVAFAATKGTLRFKQLQFASFGVRAFKKFSGVSCLA